MSSFILPVALWGSCLSGLYKKINLGDEENANNQVLCSQNFKRK